MNSKKEYDQLWKEISDSLSALNNDVINKKVEQINKTRRWNTFAPVYKPRTSPVKRSSPSRDLGFESVPVDKNFSFLKQVISNGTPFSESCTCAHGVEFRKYDPKVRGDKFALKQKVVKLAFI